MLEGKIFEEEEEPEDLEKWFTKWYYLEDPEGVKVLKMVIENHYKKSAKIHKSMNKRQ